MSRGGRGGRFGGGGGAGSMGGQMLPFEVDMALESEINAYREKEGQDEADEWTKQLFPNMKIYPQPSATASERRLIQKRREHRTAMRNGPFFIDAPKSGKRDLSSFNAFEDQASFINKRAKRTRGLPNLKKLPIVPGFFPPELHDVITTTTSTGDPLDPQQPPKRNLDWLKKKRIDKLAQFDENGAQNDDDNDDNDDVPKDDENNGEDDVEEPQDDDFSEDDDDLGNDYNAEKYFDDGEDGDGDDGGGDEGGGEDAW
ncbi:uncharacterized protein K489DRAFT_382329 [Dissoconium aciculare CBS 342.82]|uniref:DNA-directed RNA polymerase III subunit n=1 Tax=Dissoconium aciculare CBS 342.82 TaxID=1314786 RepID=A0A6J3LZR8_9PEZI|nr:uncharacterized protein K489DRAFT_382329 [Dissoconium aciculare CBS 342.82]KAF1821285.1 hypothetical protein K489DRAFT_382329 [Dissoconium aciculare CBS 342.82]